MIIDPEDQPDRLSLALARIQILRHLGAGSLESGMVVASMIDDVTVEAWTEMQRSQRMNAKDAELLRTIGDEVRNDLGEKVAAEQARRRRIA